MSNTLTHVEFTQLPHLTSNGLFLKLQMESWKKRYAEAGSQKEQAWRMYQDAVDNELPRAEIEDLYSFACMHQEISDEAWTEWDKATTAYLQLFN
jgi:hypothetical protein